MRPISESRGKAGCPIRPYPKDFLATDEQQASNPWLGASAHQANLLILQGFRPISTPKSLTRLITLNQKQREARPSAGLFASTQNGKRRAAASPDLNNLFRILCKKKYGGGVPPS
jgi:hypothetical protein